MNTGGIDMFPDFDAENVECYEDVEDEDTEYRPTLYRCLLYVMKDYNIDVSHITPKMAEHLFEDFMEKLIRAGYVDRREDNEQAD